MPEDSYSRSRHMKGYWNYVIVYFLSAASGFIQDALEVIFASFGHLKAKFLWKKEFDKKKWRVKLKSDFTRLLTKFSCAKSAKNLVTLITWLGIKSRALWLVIRAGKMSLSCAIGTTRCVPQENFSRKPYDKSFMFKVGILAFVIARGLTSFSFTRV